MKQLTQIDQLLDAIGTMYISGLTECDSNRRLVIMQALATAHIAKQLELLNVGNKLPADYFQPLTPDEAVAARQQLTKCTRLYGHSGPCNGTPRLLVPMTGANIYCWGQEQPAVESDDPNSPDLKMFRADQPEEAFPDDALVMCQAAFLTEGGVKVKYCNLALDHKGDHHVA